jgi:tRNA(fMet)-specific endonuclease VapC
VIWLDTNVAISVLGDRAPKVRRRFDEARSTGAPLGMSIVVYHELMYGAAISPHRANNERKIALFIGAGNIAIAPLREADAQHAADIRAHLKRLGTPIGPYDVLIAAQARSAGDPLVSANCRAFERVPGLTVLDWAKA